MRRNHVRAVLGLATTALAGGIALTGAGAASAAIGGGFGGPGWKQTCISAGGGQVSAQVTTNFASNNRTEQIIIWDYTTGGQALATSFPCRSGQYSYTYTLTNPTPGHDYKAEARFYGQPGSGYDYQLSPDLWY
ncbi:hypothetical protein J2S46_001485 [Kitasatospora herbaricolor]|uniref:hypothetical protein n=1 Tax=Kitasatospora herbaricolor TaxID=68217 RepID=UPI0017492851|nr:hypothetical protein [Kitasatospora herbaricolor]MDQ0306929.1 hypothetical protein [Kitasatospora herbaricolor]